MKTSKVSFSLFQVQHSEATKFNIRHMKDKIANNEKQELGFTTSALTNKEKYVNNWSGGGETIWRKACTCSERII